MRARGHDDDPGAGDVRPPAQVEVLADEVDVGVEPAERGEQVGADEGGAAGDVEDVAHGVVLLLVELAALDRGGGRAELVGGHADVAQVPGVVPVDDLGADDAGVGPHGLLDEEADGVGVEAHVVVEEQVEGGALHAAEHLVARRSEAGVGVEAAQHGPGQHGPQAPFEVAGAAAAAGGGDARGP